MKQQSVAAHTIRQSEIPCITTQFGYKHTFCQTFVSRTKLFLLLQDIQLCLKYINVLQPTGHVMHQQFNIQQLYALPTLYLCVLYLSENKQRLVPLTA